MGFTVVLMCGCIGGLGISEIVDGVGSEVGVVCALISVCKVSVIGVEVWVVFM